jgi:hypothetical protein
MHICTHAHMHKCTRTHAHMHTCIHAHSHILNSHILNSTNSCILNSYILKLYISPAHNVRDRKRNTELARCCQCCPASNAYVYTYMCACCFVLLIPTPEESRVPRVNPGVTASKLFPPLLPSLATPGPSLPYRPLQKSRYYYYY